MEIPDGVKDLLRTLLGREFALLDRSPCPQFAFEIADVSGGDQQVPGPNDHGQVAGFLFGK